MTQLPCHSDANAGDTETQLNGASHAFPVSISATMQRLCYSMAIVPADIASRDLLPTPLQIDKYAYSHSGPGWPASGCH